MSKILVTGGATGLGALIVKHLENDGHQVYVYDIASGDDVLNPNVSEIPEIDVLINNAGKNDIGWLADFTSESWDKVMDVNAKGIFMMTKALLPQLKASRGTVLNIVSNAAHRPMRCSSAYNASKGAALMLTKQLARELNDDGITVFSVSPNKLAGTDMSAYIDKRVVETRGWDEETARNYQLNGLAAGEETDPEAVAEFIAFLLASKKRHKYLVGCDMPYGL